MKTLQLAKHHFRHFRIQEWYWIFWGVVWAYQALEALIYWEGSTKTFMKGHPLALFAVLVLVLISANRNSVTNNAFLKTRPFPQLIGFLVYCALPFCLYMPIPLLREIPLAIYCGFGVSNILWAWADHLLICLFLFLVAWQIGALMPAGSSPTRWGLGATAGLTSFAFFKFLVGHMTEATQIGDLFGKYSLSETYYFTMLTSAAMMSFLCLIPAAFRFKKITRAAYLILVILPMLAVSLSCAPAYIVRGLTTLDLKMGGKGDFSTGRIEADNTMLKFGWRKKKVGGEPQVSCQFGFRTWETSAGEIVLPRLTSLVLPDGQQFAVEKSYARKTFKATRNHMIRQCYDNGFILETKTSSDSDFVGHVSPDYSAIKPLKTQLSRVKLIVDATAEKGHLVRSGLELSGSHKMSNGQVMLKLGSVFRDWKPGLYHKRYWQSARSEIKARAEWRWQNLHLKRVFSGPPLARQGGYAFVVRDKKNERGEVMVWGSLMRSYRGAGAFPAGHGLIQASFRYPKRDKNRFPPPDPAEGKRDRNDLVLDIVEIMPSHRWTQAVPTDIRFGQIGSPKGDWRTFRDWIQKDPLEALRLMAAGEFSSGISHSQRENLGKYLPGYNVEEYKDLLFKATMNYPELSAIIVTSGLNKDASHVWLDLAIQGVELPPSVIQAFLLSADDRLLNALLDQQRCRPSPLILCGFQLYPDWMAEAFTATREGLGWWKMRGGGQYNDYSTYPLRTCGVWVQDPFYGPLAATRPRALRHFLPFIADGLNGALAHPEQYTFDFERMCYVRKEKGVK